MSSSRIQEEASTDPKWRTYLVRGKTTFDVPAEYRLVNFVGEGAFGTVCSADRLSEVSDPSNPEDSTPQRVAVKRIEIQHDNILEVRRLVRELYLLDHFEHDNVVGLLDIWPLRHRDKFNEIYLTQELMDADLQNIIKSKQPLTAQHIRFLLYQIMRGLKAIHSAGVLHRDLKPSNILINSNCDLKLADFGLARETDESDEPMTLYVATRWYRAPELLMQHGTYDAAVDIWAAGCIFAEMMRRRPLLTGSNYLDQLNLIVKLLGKPPREDLIGIPKALEYVQHKLPDIKGMDFAVLFPNEDPDAIDLLKQMLQFNPRKRPTAAEALKHRYFAGLHDPSDEPDCPVFDLKMPEMTMAELKQLIFNKLLKYHPDFAGMWNPANDKDMLKGVSDEANM